jgi:hypothetical protein
LEKKVAKAESKIAKLEKLAEQEYSPKKKSSKKKKSKADSPEE